MFSRRKKRIYLDEAASAVPSKKAQRVYAQHAALLGNPSSLHTEGVQAKTVLTDARVRLARLAQVRPHNVVFTSGATEANTLAIQGYIDARIDEGAQPIDMHVLYHAGSHASVVENVLALKNRGVQVEELTLQEGLPDIQKIEAHIRPETVLIVLELVSGETGTIFDTRDVRRAIDHAVKKTDRHIHLHVDASQAPRVHSIGLSHVGADSLSLDAQKVGGVRGIGALLLSHTARISSIMHGGPQENGLRPGTENPALASAFVTSLEECEKNRAQFLEKASRLRAKFLSQLSSIERMEVHESKEHAPHIVNVSFLGRDTDYLLFLLDAQGIAVSTKSACESAQEGSRMVLLMTGDPDRARSTLRISWGPETAITDLVTCANAIQENVRFLDKTAIY
jgi:cysteine desulfurase